MKLSFLQNAKKVSKDGKRYLVSKVTLLVPGVLSGSKGPLFYPKKEIQKSVDGWNDIPIVVEHPTRNGVPVTAQSSGVVKKQGIGFLRNPKISNNGSLVADGWFCEEDMKRIDKRIKTLIENGEKIEVSTGLFTEDVEREGSFNGRKYEYIATNYKPDHLAVLPDDIGACSVKDGCGVNNKLNKEKSNMAKGKKVSNEWSEEARQAAIEARRRNAKSSSVDSSTRTTKDLAPVEIPSGKDVRVFDSRTGDVITKKEADAYLKEWIQTKKSLSRAKAYFEKNPSKETKLSSKAFDFNGPKGLSEKEASEAYEAHKKAYEAHYKAFLKAPSKSESSEAHKSFALKHKEQQEDYREYAASKARQEAFMRVNPKTMGDEEVKEIQSRKVVTNLASYEAIRKQLTDILYRRYNSEQVKNSYVNIEDMYDDSVVFSVYRDGVSEIFKVGYMVDKNDVVRVSDDETAVVRKVSYVAKDSPMEETSENESEEDESEEDEMDDEASEEDENLESNMEETESEEGDTEEDDTENAWTSAARRKSLEKRRQEKSEDKPDEKEDMKNNVIDSIINNGCGCWVEEDREVLKSFSLEKLGRLKANMKSSKSTNVVNGQATMTEAEWFAKAPESVRNVVANAVNAEKKEKASIVSNMVADVEDDSEKSRISEMLMKKSLDELKDLSKLVRSTKTDFVGNNAPFTNNADFNHDEDILDLPRISWKK
jgi:hypothetical protein